MSKERMRKITRMIAAFARSIETDYTNKDKLDTIWLIEIYCKEYRELLEGEE